MFPTCDDWSTIILDTYRVDTPLNLSNIVNLLYAGKFNKIKTASLRALLLYQMSMLYYDIIKFHLTQLIIVARFLYVQLLLNYLKNFREKVMKM